MRQKTKGKGKQNRRNKAALFLGTLSVVLLCGMLVLAGLFLWQRSQTSAGGEEETAEEPPETRESSEHGPEWEEIAGAGDSAVVKAEEIAQPQPEAVEPQSRYGSLLDDPERMRQENVYTVDAASEDEVTLLFAGDVLFDEGYAVMSHLKLKGKGVHGVMSDDLLTLMQNADVFMLNNEFPYSNRGTPLEDKQFTFRARPETTAYLQDMGVDIVSLANNHTYDYGEEAFLDTLSTLRDAQIAYVGAGENIAEASRAAYFVVNDFKVGILAATQIERLDNPDTKGAAENSPGVFRCWNVEPLLAQIRQVKENCDYLVVHIHWGTENVSEVDWGQETQAARIVEAGADLVVGDHPHCLQEIRMIQGVPVLYSLGNFWFNSRELDTGLLRVTLNPSDGETVSLQFVAAKQRGCETFLLDSGEKERVLAHMRELSPTVSIDADGFFR